MALSDKLLTLRTARKLTQRDASVRIGITDSSLGRFERGAKLPSPRLLCQIADFYEVDPDSLIDDSREILYVKHKARSSPNIGIAMKSDGGISSADWSDSLNQMKQPMTNRLLATAQFLNEAKILFNSPGFDEQEFETFVQALKELYDSTHTPVEVNAE